ncbi:MAG: alpha-mannosidase [Ruminococcaceae bacterium]|nr:alpha-mannosidase [Oscillospiraceae bacterium]
MENSYSKKIHMICNAHIDPIWQWDLPEGVSATLSTFYSAVRLAEEFDYIFCHNEVTVYKYVEEYAPELFAKIQELVKAGKWHIMGGWYLQPDCNMPSGESFVRQIREGQRYFMEKFGVCPTTAINLDPFGHTRGLVQIVKKCGQDSYMLMRPFSHEMALPSDQFIWRGFDGSEIKATRICHYGSGLGKSAKVIRDRANIQHGKVGVALWGVGNHGGGPSHKDLSDIREQLLSDKDIEFVHSTPEAFFSEIEPSEIVDTSLRISMPGCYSSMYRVKKLHAQLENEISIAEKACSMAYLTGALENYPENQIKTAVEDLLNAEFHDVLPGTSVQCGEDAGIRYLNHGILEAERAKIKAYFALSASQERAKEGEYPVVIFNPHPYELRDNVECEFSLADQNWSESVTSQLRVVDENGNTVPYQIIKEESNLTLDWRKRVIFEATLKPLALTRYSIYVDFKPTEQAKREEAFVFDNGRKRVEIDKESGLLRSYKIDGVEYLGEGFGLYALDDNADPWGMSREQLSRMGKNKVKFDLSREPSGAFKGMKSVQVVENGEIYLGVEAFFEHEATRARILYKIYKNSDDVDIDVTLLMGDINKIIKLGLPISAQGALIGQSAFGTDDLFMDGRENVAHRFVALDLGDTCVALLNNGVYGSHYEDGTLYMSLVRGVTYCAHPIGERPLLPLDRFTKKIDQGESNFSFRLALARREQLERKAQHFVQRPYALNIFPVPALNGAKKSISVAVGGDIISVPTIKKAYDRDAVIFRLLNNTQGKVDSYIEVNGQRLTLSFGKYEAKTVIYENNTLTESYEMII